jgi:ATP-dependent RNA helicase DOB1
MAASASVAEVSSRLVQLRTKVHLERQCAALEEDIDKSKALVMRSSLSRMKRVLRRLACVDAEDVVQLKGRVACEVNSADELLCTELMFAGAFNDLTPEQVAAAMSCMVAADRPKDDEGVAAELPDELAVPLHTLQEAARRVAKVKYETGEEIDVEETVKSFSPALMQVVYAWAKGTKFAEVATMTKEFEGSIIRVIRRLEELLRQLADAARAIGDDSLMEKFRQSAASLRRDIVFAASLYV